jgi:hypothetical protein
LLKFELKLLIVIVSQVDKVLKVDDFLLELIVFEFQGSVLGLELLEKLDFLVVLLGNGGEFGLLDLVLVDED